MKAWLRTLSLVCLSSLLAGGDCMFGRAIVDEKSRYYPSDDIISCLGTRCSDLPEFELMLPPPLEVSEYCSSDHPAVDLLDAAQGSEVLSQMRLVLRSERPLNVHLDTLQVYDACLVLAGPVHLTLGVNSKLSDMTVLLGPVDALPEKDVRAAPAAARRVPTLYLGYAELERVSIRPLDAAHPSGSAEFEFSACEQCEVDLDAFSVAESTTRSSRLSARTLHVVGGALEAVELSFERGLLTSMLGIDVRTARCKALSLVGSSVGGRATQIGPCDCGLPTEPSVDVKAAEASLPKAASADAGELDADSPEAGPPDAGLDDAGSIDAGPSDAGAMDAGSVDAGPSSDAGAADAGAMDAGAADAGPTDAGADASVDDGIDYGLCRGATLSRTDVFGGMVDGRVHAVHSMFQSVLFARRAPTSLELLGGQIGLSVVCDHPLDVRLDHSASVACTSCDHSETTTACRLDYDPIFRANTCEVFSDGLPRCEGPRPARP